LVNQTSELFR